MIEVNNLVKRFGPKKAVNGVSFKLERGDVLGFLGPNGAGKSTTMRMVTGYIPMTSGSISVGGMNITDKPEEVKKLIGYLPENAPTYPGMSVRGFLKFCAEIRGIKGSAASKAIDRVVGMCFLDNVIHQNVDTLSKGYRHRVCFAQSIIHDPDVLIMDEPTDGLDPNQKQEVRKIIKQMGEKKAIIFSTHILEEVEAVCNRAIIIDQGQKVEDGTPDEIKKKAKNAGSVIVEIAGASAGDVKNKLSQIQNVGTVDTLNESDQSVSIRVFPKSNESGQSLSGEIYKVASSSAWNLVELHTDPGRLDDVFRRITFSETGKANA